MVIYLSFWLIFVEIHDFRWFFATWIQFLIRFMKRIRIRLAEILIRLPNTDYIDCRSVCTRTERWRFSTGTAGRKPGNTVQWASHCFPMEKAGKLNAHTARASINKDIKCRKTTWGTRYVRVGHSIKDPVWKRTKDWIRILPIKITKFHFKK